MRFGWSRQVWFDSYVSPDGSLFDDTFTYTEGPITTWGYLWRQRVIRLSSKGRACKAAVYLFCYTAQEHGQWGQMCGGFRCWNTTVLFGLLKYGVSQVLGFWVQYLEEALNLNALEYILRMSDMDCINVIGRALQGNRSTTWQIGMKNSTTGFSLLSPTGMLYRARWDLPRRWLGASEMAQFLPCIRNLRLTICSTHYFATDLALFLIRLSD